MLVAAMCFSSCSSTGDERNVVKKQYRVSGVASKIGGVLEEDGDFGSTTRSIFIGGSSGNRFFLGWDDLDEAHIYRSGVEVGVLTPEENAVTTTNLIGDLDGTFAVGDEFQLYVPSNEWDFTDQTGSVGSMSNHAYMSALATVSNVEGSTVTVSDMTFSSKCIYIIYTARDQEDCLIDVKKMTIHADSDGEFVAFMDPVNNIVTYTDEIVINCEKESKTDNYPTKTYASLIYTGRPICTYTIETGDGKIYERSASKISAFSENKGVTFGLKCTCINVDAGVSTGITPPSDEDVTIDDVTKE